MEPLWESISEHIATATGVPFPVRARRPVVGGCINAAWVVEGGGRAFFVKVNDMARAPMFAAEAAGLVELAASEAVRVPEPVCWGAAAGAAYLVMEHVALGAASAAAGARLGRRLAHLHRTTRSQHGWHRDNTIGSTLQPNGPMDDWVAFFRERRLLFQLDLAARAGHGALERDGARLAARLGTLFRGYAPTPSLLHGDLWSGNWAADTAGEPVLFDPAVYYGDRESDLAMTELFGGFPAEFYAAYRETWSLDPGYGVRKRLYQLYHVLNHLNLFGGGYHAQAQRLIGYLLSELR